ncbi:MAG TPA: DUF3995 domain-containing protein [Capillimicrobium sp.]|jgi:hypothetical protein
MRTHDDHSPEPPAPPDALARLVPGTLAAIAGVHAAWALGWRWPGGTDQALSDRVVGDGVRLPPNWLTALVAGTLLAGASAVRGSASGAEGLERVAAWTVAGALLARAAVSVPMDLAGGLRTTYSRLDLAIYSPLSVALGAGTVRLLTRPAPAEVAR